jgi:hypothetical protein
MGSTSQLMASTRSVTLAAALLLLLLLFLLPCRQHRFHQQGSR